MYTASRCMPGAAGPCMLTSKPGSASCCGRVTATLKPQCPAATRLRKVARRQDNRCRQVLVSSDVPVAASAAAAADTAELDNGPTSSSKNNSATSSSPSSERASITTVADDGVTQNGLQAVTASQLPAKALLQAVTISATETLAPQPSWQAAVAALIAVITQTANHLAATLPQSVSSGALRFEVPLPRGSYAAGNGLSAGFTSLQWLQGQEILRSSHHQVYFSGRHSTAPDTPGTAAAEAAADGWSAVAGLGAAWLWQGCAQQQFDSSVMMGVQRFLSEGQPRLRVLGGSRFDQSQVPAPEWEAFGSHLFLLPQVEVSEVDGSLLMAVNCAWDSRLPQQQSVNAAAAGHGPATLSAAVDQALNTLTLLQPPARASSPSLAPATGPAVHTPDAAGWQSLMDDVIRELRTAAAAAGSSTAAAAAASVDTDLARQEFISGGQQGLDELLSALRQGDPDPTPLATLQEEAEDEQTAAADGGGSSGGGNRNAGSGVNGVSGRSSNTSYRLSTVSEEQQQQQQQQRTVVTQPQQHQQQQQLVKVVLARRTALPWHYTPNLPQNQQDNTTTSTTAAAAAGSSIGWQRVSGTVLLQALQERDPRAYQLYLSTPPGAAFLACTPERLYVRSGRQVASEAVAGTRPRGPPGDLEADFYQGLDLLQSPKDHAEFTVVRDWIKQQLTPLCVQLKTEVQKSVLKQSSVQHLYGRLAGVLKRGVGDAAVLAALHPTPAVCGRPRDEALRYLEANEPFDRGFYAGPFGWVSGQGAEFVVAIRSALLPAPATAPTATDNDNIQQGQLLAYAGVGVVPGSEAAAEWQELCLKVRQFEGLLSPLLAPAVHRLPNQVMAWAVLLVEELTRLGVSTFAVAPGSRSSPLALAAASHPRSQLTVAIDERSLGFWALGFSRANPSGMPAAVICSSGTAVANLLPAVVEASQSNVPLLLLTADRPYELRDTGANQTIDQIKIFGGYTRWNSDVTPPSEHVPGRVIVSTADTAVRYCTAAPRPGPVHLNFQFREPLAPRSASWNADQFLQGLEHWVHSAEPYTSAVSSSNIVGVTSQPQPQQQQLLLPHAARHGVMQQSLGYSSISGAALPVQQQQQQRWPSNAINHLPQPSAAAAAAASSSELVHVLRVLQQAKRGLVVVGEQSDSGAAAAAVQLAAALGYAVAADVLSGLRVGSSGGSSSSGGDKVLHHLDHVLLSDGSSSSSSSDWWSKIQPDVVLQLGPRVTSKRINQFMEWSATRGSPWFFIHPGPERHDANHLVTCHINMTPQQLLQTVMTSSSSSSSSSSDYAALLSQLDAVAAAQIDATLDNLDQLSEMAVARQLSDQIPLGSGLFLGNSMPIRDMDMYAGSRYSSRRTAAATAAAEVHVNTIVADNAAAAAASSSDLEHRSSSSSSSSGLVATAAAAANGVHDHDQNSDHDDDMMTSLNPTGIGSLPPGGFISSSPNISSSSSSRPQNHSTSPAAVPEILVGIPVAANRGASGIDGVLSTAAGFASGLRRPVTLVIGDLSFLHDVNGLSLLRGGEMSPPLTVILVNNKGGGIFSFLPVADAVGREAFERLWGTPQNVDLEGLCRAHGIPHQRVTSPSDLSTALTNAWGINRHSVVEVITDRQQNITLHKQLQADVQSAVHKAYDLLMAADSSGSAAVQQQQQQWGALPLLPSLLLSPPLVVSRVEVSSYSLRLTKPLTSTDRQQQGSAANDRRGLLLTVTLTTAAAAGCSSSSGSSFVRGIGEAAPLPGLHTETYDQVSAQLQMLTHLLEGLPVPYTLPLLSSLGFSRWLRSTVGLNPNALYPTVRFALESALLRCIAEVRGCSITDLLLPTCGSTAASSSSSSSSSVAVNALLPGTGTAAKVLTAAQQLVARGYKTLKVKVGRRLNPEDDAAVIVMLHQHLTHLGLTLTSDANRAWTLNQALQFGRALKAGLAPDSNSSNGSSSSSALAYIEEPTADPADMATFFAETGIPVAVDESLDEGLVGPSTLNPRSTTILDLNPTTGLAAVVIKPSMVGGLEAAWGLARWAQQQGIRAVISSSFESSVGMAALVHLAAAVDAGSSSSGGGGNGAAGQQQQQQRGSSSTLANGLWAGLGGAVLPMSHGASLTAAAAAAATAAAAGSGKHLNQQSLVSGGYAVIRQQQQQQQWHGLGTLSWFEDDVVSSSKGLQQYNAELPTAAACSLLQDTAVAAAAATAEQNGTSNAAAAAAVTQQEVHMQSVVHEVLTASGVRMQVTGILAQPMQPAHPCSSSSSGSGRALPVVLLHGFMGSAADWQPLMSALAAAGHPCLAANLPGHGGSGPSSSSCGSSSSGSVMTDAELEDCYSIPAAAAAVEAVAAATFGSDTPCLLVGYSMGARVALQICLGTSSSSVQQQQQPPADLIRSSSQSKVSWAGAVVISGTPGIPDQDLRSARILKDAELADMLSQLGSERFISWWYDQPLWKTLKAHPGFDRMLQKRVLDHHGNEQGLALALKYGSTGRMQPLWGQLKSCYIPLLLVAGQADSKFAGIKRRMAARLRQGSAAAAEGSQPAGSSNGSSSNQQQQQQRSSVISHQWAELPGVGHAVHVEAPLQLLELIQGFIAKLQQ